MGCKSIHSNQFKAQCETVLADIVEHKQSYVIMQGDVPIAEVVPVRKLEDDPAFKKLQNSVQIHGDILSPIDEQWDDCL